jgi:hypothetical protein
MSYIGNEPDFTTYTLSVEKFSGTGACTEFTLSRDVSDANTVQIVVNGVPQVPIDSYSVNAGLLTFTEAPSSGANNIVITYLVYGIVRYDTLGPDQIAPSAVTETAIATGAVTSTKIPNAGIKGNNLDNNTIRANNIVAGAITGNLIANNAISGNNIVSPPDIFDDAFLFGGM